ncbi:hypothetical protein ABTK80_19960, partial [Acinetobacter baumannii]
LAACAVGLWDQETLATRWQAETRFVPAMAEAERKKRYAGWKKAVERAMRWASEEDEDVRT